MGRPPTDKETLFRRAKAARGETADIDFKAAFDSKCWPEVVKDLVAMANSGGGALVFGVDDDGHTSHADLTEISGLDPAVLSDQIRKFTGSPFADVGIRQATRRGGAPAVLVLVGAVDVPLIFEKPGTYADPDRPEKQKLLLLGARYTSDMAQRARPQATRTWSPSRIEQSMTPVGAGSRTSRRLSKRHRTPRFALFGSAMEKRTMTFGCNSLTILTLRCSGASTPIRLTPTVRRK